MIVFINSIAVISLVCLWPTDRDGLWWCILIFLFLHWFTTRVARVSKEIEAKAFVIRFWSRVSGACRLTCFGASWIGILLAFR